MGDRQPCNAPGSRDLATFNPLRSTFVPQSRDLSTFDPLQSTFAHRFRSCAPPGGGYTCVTLLSPDREDLLPDPPPPELLAAADCDNLAASRDFAAGGAAAAAAHRCLEPLLSAAAARKPAPPPPQEHGRGRCAVATDAAVCSTCVAKHRHLQSQHAVRSRQSNMAAAAAGNGS